MKCIQYIIMLAVLSCSFVCHGDQGGFEQLFEKANKAYISGDSKEALTLYEQVLSERGASVELLYNLGNAYYKNGDVGNAVLFLERAKWLQPGDADIAKNLEAVRNNGGVVEEDSPLIKRYAMTFSFNQWCKMISGLIALFALLVWVRIIQPKLISSQLFKHISIVLSVFLIISIYGVIIQFLELGRSVVTAESATVRISPFEQAEEVATLKPGRILYVAEKHGDFYAVSEQSGMTGWVTSSEVKKVIP